MIIGINGKIGSGKDTVGSIIQYLTSTDSSGKALGHIKLGYAIKGYHNSTFEIKKFAGKLKQTASLLTGISVEKFEDQEFKMINLSDEWSSLQQSGRSKVLLPMTVRTFLQKLGTEAMREGLHTNVWVNALFADYKPLKVRSADSFDLETYDGKYPKWIITDMRFPNEMEAVKARKGITIRVVRNQIKTGNLVLEHPSETALDNAKFDYEIINDGTIEDLIEKVKEILIKENII
jgi:hypothetical protein